MNSDGINQLADGVMRGVVRMLGDRISGNEEKACEIMRQECKGFFGIGERADAYKNTREAVLAHTLSEQWAMADIVTGCVDRIIKEVL